MNAYALLDPNGNGDATSCGRRINMRNIEFTVIIMLLSDTHEYYIKAVINIFTLNLTTNKLTNHIISY